MTNKIAALCKAMMMSSGLDKSEATEQVVEQNNYTGLGLLGSIKALLVENAVLDINATDQQVADTYVDVMEGRTRIGSPQLGLGVTSHDLTRLISTTAGVALRNGFKAAQVTYLLLTQELFVADLKATNAYSTSETSDAELIPEGQAPKMAVLSETGAPITMRHYGRCLLISEEAILNDNLGLVTTAPARLGRGIARRINYLFWSRLLTGAGPTMAEDSTAMFTAAHGNLMTAAALSEASLALACQAMLSRNLQTPGVGEVIPGGIMPRFLAVGPSNALLAAKLCGADYTPVEGWKITPVVDPLIESISGGHPWFLFADAAAVDGAAVAYLKGWSEPRLQTRYGTVGQAKGLWIDADIYCDVVYTEYRSIVKNPGA